jgi:hypothetical protein
MKFAILALAGLASAASAAEPISNVTVVCGNYHSGAAANVPMHERPALDLNAKIQSAIQGARANGETLVQISSPGGPSHDSNGLLCVSLSFSRPQAP